MKKNLCLCRLFGSRKIRKSQLAKLQKRDSIAKKDSVAIALADVSDIEYEKLLRNIQRSS